MSNEVDDLCEQMEETELEENNWQDLCNSYIEADNYIEFYNKNRYYPMESTDALVKPIQMFLKREFELKCRYFSGPYRPEYVEENSDDHDFRLIVEELDFFIGHLKKTIDGRNDVMYIHDKLNELLIYDRELTKHLIVYSKRTVREGGCMDSFPTPFDEASDYEEEFNDEYKEYEDDLGYYYCD